MEDLLPRLREAFPDMPDKTLRQIVRRGCHEMNKRIVRSREVEIDSRRKGVRFLVFKHSPDPTKPR